MFSISMVYIGLLKLPFYLKIFSKCLLTYYQIALYSWNMYSIPCSVKKFSSSFTSEMRMIKKARPPTHKTFFIKVGSLAYKSITIIRYYLPSYYTFHISYIYFSFQLFYLYIRLPTFSDLHNHYL